MWTLLIIALTLILLYIMVILRLFRGLVQGSPALVPAQDDDQDPEAHPSLGLPEMVSLIIPFRNEIRHLSFLLKDLEMQRWPAERMEVILVNDHSEDGSGEWVKAYIRDHPRFRYLDLEAGVRGKKKALAEGIHQARGEWVIQTDADCRLGPRFIASHMAAKIRTGADLIAGPVTTLEKRGGMMEVLERLDLLSLAGVAAGSFALGRPLLCSGANLSYSRKLFMETRPYDPSREVASGDDMFLMIGARKLGKRLAYMTASDAVVSTFPAGSLRNLIDQRIRWGAKAGRYGMPDIQGLALLTLLTHFIFLAMPWLVIFRPEVWVWLVPAFVGKTLADLLLLNQSAGFTGQRRDLRMFLPVIMVYYPFMGVVMTGSLFRKAKWKG